jgi:hypothetical protein
MKLGAADLRRVQSSVFAALLMIAIGAGALVTAFERTATAERAARAAQSERDEYDHRLQQVSEEEKEIRAKSALFAELQTRGIIGDEQRLDWVELLKEIRDAQRLIEMHYEIAPQKPLDAGAGAAANTGGFSFQSSSMLLRLKLLHEEDLTRLLDELRQRARALVVVRHCNVVRLPRGGGERLASLAQLQAECRIDWITVRSASTP